MDLKSAQKTPSNFFEEQRKAIWESAKENQENSSYSKWRSLKLAAVFIGLIIGVWMAVSEPIPKTCQTFACLWETTNPEEIQLTPSETELWLEDDILFETLTYDDEIHDF